MRVLPVETAYPSKRRPVVPVVTEKVSWTGLGRLYGNVVADQAGAQNIGPSVNTSYLKAPFP